MVSFQTECITSLIVHEVTFDLNKFKVNMSPYDYLFCMCGLKQQKVKSDLNRSKGG